MPYPNEHAARVRDPGEFQANSFRRMRRVHEGKEYFLLVGRPTGKAKTTTQAIRYPEDKWTAAQARAHSKAHGAKGFEAAKAAASRRALSAECPSIVLSHEGGVWRRVGGKLWMHPALEIGRTYQHPQDGWELPVDEEFAQRLANNVAGAAARGVDMPLLRNHSFDEKLDANNAVLGYVKGAILSDGWLYLLNEFQGAEAEAECRKVDRVSVGLLEKMQDGDGETYKPALHHLAITPFPVVNRQQEDYVPVAASRGRSAALAPVLTMSAASEGGPDMDRLLEILRGLLDREDLSEETAADALQEWADARGKDVTALADAQGKVKALEAKVAELKTGAKDKGVKLDPDAEDQLVEGAEQQLEALAASGRITPAVREKLKAALVGEPGARNTWALSRAVSGRPTSLARDVLTALKDNNVVELAEKTGRQTVTASRSSPDGAEYSQKVHDDMKALGRSGETVTKY